MNPDMVPHKDPSPAANPEPSTEPAQQIQPISSDETITREQDPFLDAAKKLIDDELLLSYINGGKEPNLTPLMARATTRSEINREYNDTTKHSIDGDGPFSIIDRIYSLFSLKAREQYYKNEEGIRDQLLQSRGNHYAFKYGVHEPMKLVYKGDLAGALACYGKALDAAPHRAEDIYFTLGNLCLELMLWQREMRSESPALRHRPGAVVDSWTLSSPLQSNRIDYTIERNGEKFDLWSVSSVPGSHHASLPPINWSALREELMEGAIPLRQLATAAFQRALDLNDPSGPEHTPQSAREHMSAHLKGVLQWLHGDNESAIATLKQGLEVGTDKYHKAFRNEVTPLVDALYDAGHLEETVEVSGKALGGLATHSEFADYLSFFELCEELAKLRGTGSASSIALPYIKEIDDHNRKIHKDNNSDWLPSYFLTKAYDDLGMKSERDAQAASTAQILEYEMQYFSERAAYDPESSKIYEEMKTALADILK